MSEMKETEAKRPIMPDAGADNRPLVELTHVEKHYGDLHVLKDINLTVRKGEVLVIVGPSGSGKSTLLRCATMLEKMDGGEIVYLGKKAAWTDKDGHVVYADKKDMKEIRSQYGLVFQNFNLFPHYSVLKNIVDAPIHVQKRDKETVYKEARELLKKWVWRIRRTIIRTSSPAVNASVWRSPVHWH